MLHALYMHRGMFLDEDCESPLVTLRVMRTSCNVHNNGQRKLHEYARKEAVEGESEGVMDRLFRSPRYGFKARGGSSIIGCGQP